MPTQLHRINRKTQLFVKSDVTLLDLRQIHGLRVTLRKGGVAPQRLAAGTYGEVLQQAGEQVKFVFNRGTPHEVYVVMSLSWLRTSGQGLFNAHLPEGKLAVGATGRVRPKEGMRISAHGVIADADQTAVYGFHPQGTGLTVSAVEASRILVTIDNGERWWIDRAWFGSMVVLDP